MYIIHKSSIPFTPVALTHRGPCLSFRTVFVGSPLSLNNYELSFVISSSFYSPIHAHNFDQIRFAWSGSFSITPDLTIHEGELAYHPEGVSYGPQDDGEEERVLLILQFGGASGMGYLSKGQLGEANKALSERGRFEKGRYVSDEGEEKDGFQALWEWVNGGEDGVSGRTICGSNINEAAEF